MLSDVRWCGVARGVLMWCGAKWRARARRPAMWCDALGHGTLGHEVVRRDVMRGGARWCGLLASHVLPCRDVTRRARTWGDAIRRKML